MPDKITIRSIRKGSVQWNEEDRQKLGAILPTCGYNVHIGRREVPGTSRNGRKPTMEYIVEAWGDEGQLPTH